MMALFSTLFCLIRRAWWILPIHSVGVGDSQHGHDEAEDPDNLHAARGDVEQVPWQTIRPQRKVLCDGFEMVPTDGGLGASTLERDVGGFPIAVWVPLIVRILAQGTEGVHLLCKRGHQARDEIKRQSTLSCRGGIVDILHHLGVKEICRFSAHFVAYEWTDHRASMRVCLAFHRREFPPWPPPALVGLQTGHSPDFYFFRQSVDPNIDLHDHLLDGAVLLFTQTFFRGSLPAAQGCVRLIEGSLSPFATPLFFVLGLAVKDSAWLSVCGHVGLQRVLHLGEDIHEEH
mmetsp:Transcript_29362/g.63684  ORF Transcript_29362/g.63684 Transcript_29362/m.63684 type:complete len:288 (+) Transcript_29362:1662-2525(+)